MLARPPLFDALEGCSTVLMVGAGGGFDVYAGLPLAFALEGRGTRVVLANYSFAYLGECGRRPLHSSVVEVTAESAGADYFPERTLARWFAQRGEARSVFAFDAVGAIPLTSGYAALAEHVGADACVLIDGGTDIFMRGDEAGLGTPAEDICSLAAADALDVPTKLVVSLGFGVDAFHGVSHADVLETLAALQREGAYLGALSLLPEMPEVQRYLDAVLWAEERNARPSIVQGSIASACFGEYGDVHRTARTKGSKLWINPLMSTYFTVELGALARRVLYLEEIRQTTTAAEVHALIEAQRRRASRPRFSIPI